MSIRATTWAWQQSVIYSEKILLLALAEEVNGFYDCPWLEIKYLMAKTGASRATLFRAFSSLVEKKLLEGRENDGGKYFHLCLPATDVPPDDGEFLTVDGAGVVSPSLKLRPTQSQNETPKPQKSQNETACNTIETRAQAEKERVLSPISSILRGLPISNALATAPESGAVVQAKAQDKFFLPKRIPLVEQDRCQLALVPTPPPPPPAKPELPKGWVEEDRWLVECLWEQRAFEEPHLAYLLDNDFWDDVSELANGLSRQFVSAEFTRMRRWLDENPGRRPTPKGVRRFVRRWFERAAERARVQVPVNQSRSGASSWYTGGSYSNGRYLR